MNGSYAKKRGVLGGADVVTFLTMPRPAIIVIDMVNDFLGTEGFELRGSSCTSQSQRRNCAQLPQHRTYFTLETAAAFCGQPILNESNRRTITTL